ncbi:MAG: hypothetical protein K1X65_19620 [Caldilineales bacterium]|nr:hypothetical protein [Caldilineales bacterium]MCW5860710.1 hypothetical protein [Caldilineales bacterium]
MPYNEIIRLGFRTLWRQKPLWLFGLLGTLLPALGAGLYFGGILVWQQSFLTQLMALTMNQQPDYLSVMRILTGGLRGLAGVWGALACIGLIGYVVNLVMRAATVTEASRALAGEHCQSERGLAAGARKALSFFVIDLLWWLPGVVLAIGAVAFVFVVLAGLVRGVNSQDPSGIAADFVGVFGLIFGSIGCLSLVGLLFVIARGLLAPLMYQAAAQENASLGQAIRMGGRLARAHLGPMFIFLLFLTGLGVALSFSIQLFTTPLSGFWAFRWAAITENLANGIPPAPPSGLEQTSFYLLGLFFGLATWLTSAVLQTLGLTMYAEIFRRLQAPAQTSHAGNGP